MSLSKCYSTQQLRGYKLRRRLPMRYLDAFTMLPSDSTMEAIHAHIDECVECKSYTDFVGNELEKARRRHHVHISAETFIGASNLERLDIQNCIRCAMVLEQESVCRQESGTCPTPADIIGLVAACHPPGISAVPRWIDHLREHLKECKFCRDYETDLRQYLYVVNDHKLNNLAVTKRHPPLEKLRDIASNKSFHPAAAEHINECLLCKARLSLLQKEDTQEQGTTNAGDPDTTTTETVSKEGLKEELVAISTKCYPMQKLRELALVQANKRYKHYDLNVGPEIEQIRAHIYKCADCENYANAVKAQLVQQAYYHGDKPHISPEDIKSRAASYARNRTSTAGSGIPATGKCWWSDLVVEQEIRKEYGELGCPTVEDMNRYVLELPPPDLITDKAKVNWRRDIYTHIHHCGMCYKYVLDLRMRWITYNYKWLQKHDVSTTHIPLNDLRAIVQKGSSAGLLHTISKDHLRYCTYCQNRRIILQKDKARAANPSSNSTMEQSTMDGIGNCIPLHQLREYAMYIYNPDKFTSHNREGINSHISVCSHCKDVITYTREQIRSISGHTPHLTAETADAKITNALAQPERHLTALVASYGSCALCSGLIEQKLRQRGLLKSCPTAADLKIYMAGYAPTHCTTEEKAKEWCNQMASHLDKCAGCYNYAHYLEPSWIYKSTQRLESQGISLSHVPPVVLRHTGSSDSLSPSQRLHLQHCCICYDLRDIWTRDRRKENKVCISNDVGSLSHPSHSSGCTCCAPHHTHTKGQRHMSDLETRLARLEAIATRSALPVATPIPQATMVDLNGLVGLLTQFAGPVATFMGSKKIADAIDGLAETPQQVTELRKEVAELKKLLEK